jgi:hypothetical protein
MNPSYASLKINSQHKNPIAFIASEGKIYVLRKLVITEDMFLPENFTVNLSTVNSILAKVAMYSLKPEERVLEADLSKIDMDAWREKYNVFDQYSIWNLLSVEERDNLTIALVFKIKASQFLPLPIASIPLGAKRFFHKQRGREENIHCTVQFVGSLQIMENVYRPITKLTNYIPRPKPAPFSEEETLEMYRQIDLFHAKMKEKNPYFPHSKPIPVPIFQSSVYATFQNEHYLLPQLVFTERKLDFKANSNSHTPLSIDLAKIELIKILYPDVALDERIQQAFLQPVDFLQWQEQRIGKGSFLDLNEQDRDLVTLYSLFCLFSPFLPKPIPVSRNGFERVVDYCVFIE